MNKYQLINLACLCATLVCNGAILDKQVSLEVKVLSEKKPIEGANIKGGFERRMGLDSATIQNILSDSNGVALVSSKTSGKVSLKITKNGYYSHNENLDFFKQVRKGSVLSNKVIQLKDIRSPVPMFRKYVGEFVPKDDLLIGFDLEKGDWVIPYGKGVVSDILFLTNFNASNEECFKVDFNIQFPGKFNGVQPMYSEHSEFDGSLLKSDYLAPTEGYLPEICCAGGREKGAYSFKTPYEGKISGYYFRIRTVLDKNGNIKSAQYGKIYGDFKYGRRFDTKTNFTFLYYYNPDKTRNVEFDPKQNLFLKNSKGRPKTCFSIGTP